MNNMCIYIYIERERERERKKDKETYGKMRFVSTIVAVRVI